MYGERLAAGRDIIVHAGETDPVVRLSNAAHDFMSRADLVWQVHASAEVRGERGPGYQWEEQALIQVDDALFHLRAEAARTQALRPDLAALTARLTAEAHSARKFCVEDYIPGETTTSYFLVYLHELQAALTEFTRAAA
ncbi:hypothetical protein AB0M58_13820 [Streptomyces bobili]|uniref:hypothetical protein n=1 Tax=Streptomyces bobili TaxID=67280 RepID=UPI00341E5B70